MMKKSLPFIIVFVTALLLSYIYFSPLLEGKRLLEHDRLTATGAQKEYNDFYNKTGQESLWSNSMFGGMPTVTFAAKFKGNITKTIRKIEKIGAYPASFLVILILSSFLCLILFGLNPWVSLIGAIAYSFASHYFILIGAGHITKLWALAYLGPLIAAIYITLNGKKLLGSMLTMIFLSLEISSVHPQITYYGVITVFLMGLVYLVYAIRQKQLKEFFIRIVFLIVPLFIAIGVNSNYLMTTMEYSKYTTRGTTILRNENNADQGLDKQYILDYSYDLGEAFSAFIPRIKGGGMGEPLSEKSATFELVAKSQGQVKARKLIQSIPLYWGNQPIVSGPFYFGAVSIFLFVLGLFIIKGRDKWWMVSVVIVSFLLSLGAQFSFFNHLAIDYLPWYNKFRDVKNIVFIQQIGIWLIGMLALNQIVTNKLNSKEIYRALKYAIIITGGFALAFVIFPSIAGNFKGGRDEIMGELFAGVLQKDRFTAVRVDAFRSLIFVLLSAGLIMLYYTKKLNKALTLIFALALILADLWTVDKKYLNDANFVKKNKLETPFVPTKADATILEDKDPDYRVLNLTVNPWSDASTSYFHKSIGGYSGAKLRRYQDMIERHFSAEITTFQNRLKNVKTQDDVRLLCSDLNALNMLNTKYIIYNPDYAPVNNDNALGNAWFVSQIKWASDANDEIDQIDKVNISNTAIINQGFSDLIPKELYPDSLASVHLNTYAPNQLTYQTSSNAEQVLVLSEVYYPKGWQATIDGVETPYFRANYVLRAILVPAGNHEVTFKFIPETYELGNKISYASSVLMMLALVGFLFIELKKRKKAGNEKLDEKTN